MAGSRLEKIGTIFSRTTGLIKAGAVQWQDRPLWYDIYEAFPPKVEPRFDRPAPNSRLQKIFYKEDKIRAIFHRNNKQIGTVNFFAPNSKTMTQRFIETYRKIAKTYEGKAITEAQLYMETIDLMRQERESRVKEPIDEDEPISFSQAFKEAQNKPADININVKDIFKD